MASCPEWVTFQKSAHIIALRSQTRSSLCLQVTSRNAKVLAVAFTALENKQYCVRLEHENGDASLGFAADLLGIQTARESYRAYTV